jgi:succinyl-CoA synthetase beta subunit
MDLLEYQAKELFRQIGIPTLPSQKISQPTDIKELKIPYPVVLKSQVYQGKSGKAGGVHFAGNTIDATASAHALFHLSIMGKYPEVLLVEPRYESDREFYLAVILDSSTCRPLLLGSQYGGIEVEAKLEHMQQVVVDQEFSSFYARRLALKMGLKGSLIQSVSAVLEKMYDLFVQQDLDWVEINPLAVKASGELMVLDGKVALNAAAIGRHDNLVAMLTPPQMRSAPPICTSTPVQSDGDIGLLCNGTGLAMAALDLIVAESGKPASFINLGGEYEATYSNDLLLERLDQGLDLMLQDKSVKVILVNILSGGLSCHCLAEAIVGKIKQLPTDKQNPAIVVRIVGSEYPQIRERLLPLGIPVVERLDEAVTQTIAYAKAYAAWQFQFQGARLRTQSGGFSGSYPVVPSP